MTTVRYRKKPVVIEAIELTADNRDAVAMFAGPDSGHDIQSETVWIRTLEGVMTARVGDFVIRGAAGEHYPIRSDIFHATYEPVEENE